MRGAAGGEEPGADLAEPRIVDRLFVFEDLQVDEIVRAVVAVRLRVDIGAGVQLLGDLMLHHHQRDRGRLLEAEGGEELMMSSAILRSHSSLLPTSSWPSSNSTVSQWRPW